MNGTFHFAAGRSIYFCPIPEANGKPHYKLGMIGFLRAYGDVRDSGH